MKNALTVTFTEYDLAGLYSFPMGTAIVELSRVETDAKNSRKHLAEARHWLTVVLASQPDLAADAILEQPVPMPRFDPYAIVASVAPKISWLRCLVRVHPAMKYASLGAIRKADATETLSAVESALGGTS